LLEKIKHKNKFVVAVTLMENPKTGELMSKSKGTGVFLDAKPAEMFGQIMAQPDEMIKILFVNNTYLPLNEIDKIVSANPRDAKARLGFEIVKIFYGEVKANEAKEQFDKVFKNKEMPADMPIFETDKSNYLILDLLCDSKLAISKNEARRLVEGGGVEIIDGEEKTRIGDWKTNISLKNGLIIKVGNRRFVKIKIK